MASSVPPRHYSATYKTIAVLLKGFMYTFGSRRWQGTEHLPAHGGFIAAANHVVDLDPVTTAHILYDNGAPPRIMAKAELWKIPVLGSVLRATGMIPVYRGTRTASDSLTAAAEALAAGECVLIFPEGTHTQDPEQWPMVARTGVARLALTTGVPVIPIAQWGASRLMPGKAPWFRPFPRVRYQALVGEPVDLSDLAGENPSAETLTLATARIMSAITDQLALLRGETPPAQPWVRGKGRG